MATVYRDFIQRFPEFAGADEAMINAKLAEATRQVDPTMTDPPLTDLIYQLTAQKLAKTPFGNTAKLSTNGGGTVYDDELDRLRADAARGLGIT